MRRFISTLFGIVLGLGCFAGISNAANFSDKSIGISIDIDDELVKKPQWHGYHVFSAADNSASVLIKPVYDLSLYELKKELKEGTWKGDGVNLNIMGDEKSAPVAYGGGVLVQVIGRVGEYKVKGVLGAYSGFDDQNFIVVGAARPDYWNEWEQRIRAIFDSISFIELDYSEMITNWKNKIVGMSLVPQNPVRRGRLVPQPINLCSDGTVVNEKPAKTQPAARQRRVWNGYAWVTVPVTPRPRPPSRYSIVPIRGKPTLVIRQGPRPLEFELEMEGDQLLVNGKPYSITENKLCK